MLLKPIVISTILACTVGCGLVKVEEQSENNRTGAASSVDSTTEEMPGNEGMYLSLPVLPEGKFEKAIFKIYKGEISHGHLAQSCGHPKPMIDPPLPKLISNDDKDPETPVTIINDLMARDSSNDQQPGFAPWKQYKILFGKGPQKVSLPAGHYTVVVEVYNLLKPLYLGKGSVHVEAGSYNKLVVDISRPKDFCEGTLVVDYRYDDDKEEPGDHGAIVDMCKIYKKMSTPSCSIVEENVTCSFSVQGILRGQSVKSSCGKEHGKYLLIKQLCEKQLQIPKRSLERIYCTSNSKPDENDRDDQDLPEQED